MRTLRVCIVSVFSFFLASAVSVIAQVSPDLEQRMKPFGSYHGGSIDQVGLSNQNLFLRAAAGSGFILEFNCDLSFPFLV